MKNSISDSDIIELHSDGCINIEIAEILGTRTQTIAKRLRELGLTKNKRRNRFRKEYAAYNRDSGVLLAKGTMEEISEALGKGEPTLFNYASATRCNYYPLPPILIREVRND